MAVRIAWVLLASMLAFVVAGCESVKPPAAGVAPVVDREAAIRAKRATLSPEDRALVDAQEWCAISEEERLCDYHMPIKLMIEGKAVFVCCDTCRKEALKNPARTLAKLAELRERVKKQAAKPPVP